ncbi:uncharacterized protein [Dermacentor andersoni]|uniref:uncharacterized protein isoform X1 n=1 Tax=Dermacentor andersoni TaxID=34620 RepID=UPI003B3A391E
MQNNLVADLDGVQDSNGDYYCAAKKKKKKAPRNHATHFLSDDSQLQHNFTLAVQRSFYASFNPKGVLKDYAAYDSTGSIDYDDGGGAHLAVRDEYGNALSVVMSLNSEFGCLYLASCGIMMNNFMDVFTLPQGRNGLPPSNYNYIGAMNRPATTMLPVIITNGFRGTLFGVLGATGGLQGVSAMAQLLDCIGTFAVLDCFQNYVRVHPFPDKTTFSVMVGPKTERFDPETQLKTFGHNVIKGSFTATLSGIVGTDRNTWLGVADINNTDGGSRGERYINPIVKNAARAR